jgi:hypothetical protein
VQVLALQNIKDPDPVNVTSVNSRVNGQQPCRSSRTTVDMPTSPPQIALLSHIHVLPRLPASSC